MGLFLALVSNVPLPGSLYREILVGHDLNCFFTSMHFSYDHGSRKPSPALLRLALETLAVSAEGAVMVGDRRERDVAAGRAAGTATVWVRKADSAGPAADAEIEGLPQLPALLRNW
jgi:FMN phosphatase YigB (HAD superfamily)